MSRWTLALLLILLLVPAALAQSKAELKFNAKQAKVLHSYAEGAFKDGFPKIAKRVWLMLLSEYDPGHEEARAALGFDLVGDSWSMRPGFVFPKDDRPDPKKAASLQKKWKSTASKMAKGHLKLAREFDKAGRSDKSRGHYEKVLFFTADDEEAQAALEHKEIAGLTGTDLEQTLYDRSKMIEAVVAEEARKDYPVERLPDSEKNQLLENAKLTYISVKTEHFIIRGDFDEELLMEAGRYAERAYKVMEAVVEGFDGFNADTTRWVNDWAFFQDKASYVQGLRGNANLMEPEDLEFRVENTAGSHLIDRENRVFIEIHAPQNEQGVYDSAVRNVAHAYSGFASVGLREGIGHTITGMVFNNNRAFIVDRQEQLRTTTGEEDLDKYSPNMDTWKDLALESAWRLSETTPAAHLPLIDAAKFTDDARIKSWSFCDYVVRRDPGLLLDLDSCRDQGHQIEVEKMFTANHDGLSVAQLEKEWKDFWTEASPVLKAIRNNTEPLSAVSKDVKKWLTAFNEARKRLNSTDVTWSSDYSGRCRDHVEYLLAHESQRGAALEQGQDITLEGGTHLGDMFAEMALVEVEAKKAKKVFEAWLHMPGYRDSLLNYALRTIGLYSLDGILVMDAVRGVGRAPEGKGGFETYPSGNQSMPSKVAVQDLGPEIEQLLEKLGHGGKEFLGYPISLHNFGNGGLIGNRESYKCQVSVMGKPVEGFLHLADGGSNRRSSAPGMVVFYPLEPLRKGVEVEAVWIFESDSGTTRVPTKFRT
ncbi:MAG TPA: hypothetical protein EYG30_05680 [Planctomycetes bacterium]|nr:hypothetical protein [Planctomycetota bacterium]HIL51728.1 hypothetical protein [Planctomycetota bacterium]